jgi:hypothetical protein
VQIRYSALLADLSAAHVTLKAAGEDKLSDKDALVLILELSQSILDNAIAVRKTARGE